MCPQATASNLLFYDMFVPQKVPISKILKTSLHMIFGLDPSQSKILATLMLSW